MDKNFSKKIMDSIKQSDIRPINKGYFIAKKSLIMGMVGFALIFAAIVAGIVISYGTEVNIILLNKLGFLPTITHIVPTFWVIVFPLLIGLTLVYFRYTPRGYKWHIWQILIGSILFSSVAGAALYVGGVPQYVEKTLENHAPKIVQSITGNHKKHIESIWQNENKGLLIGRVIHTYQSGFSFEDSTKKIWSIYMSQDITDDMDDEFGHGDELRLSGYKTGDALFVAETIEKIKESSQKSKVRENDDDEDEDDRNEDENNTDNEDDEGSENDEDEEDEDSEDNEDEDGQIDNTLGDHKIEINDDKDEDENNTDNEDDEGSENDEDEEDEDDEDDNKENDTD